MLYLHGIGHFHPENVIDNGFLESLDLGTTDDWILERVGIRERRTVLPLEYIRTTRNADPRAAHEASLYNNAETARSAAHMALKRAGIAPEDVGMVIAGGCSPQYLIPPEACIIAAELGVEAPALDINSACSTFVAHLDFLERHQPDALPDFILLVNAENNTRTIDYTDRNTAVLWGDGSAAAVVSTRTPCAARVERTYFDSDPRGWEKVRIPTGGFFEQEGRAVQGFAIRKTVSTFRELAGGSAPDERWFVGHQANLIMLESACERAGIPGDRHLYNVDRFGNCGAAGAPSVVSEHWDSFAAGDVLAIVVVGSGLSWGGAVVRFHDEAA